MTVADIAAALGGGYRSGEWHRCRCPVHQSNGATLALMDGPRGLIVKCWGGCDPRSVLAELRRLGLLDDDGAQPIAPPDPAEIERRRAAEERDRQRRIANAYWLWSETERANWLVETYLGGRIILCPIPETIRLHRALRHKEANCRRPAMVAAVEHAEHGFVGLHCTYLSPNGEGKATAIEPVKRFIGPVGGGAVRLAPAADTVAVCEGIETSLSYMEATGTPTWAALSAGGIRSLILPPEIRNVIIACDPDPVGLLAARAAARRWVGEGRQVSIARPPGKLDFNDLALARLG
jgi:putative DNA primase/helicase